VPRPRSDISERIVDAARARFLHDGVDGASLRNIATDAGTSLGMVYYYFKTKDELFLSVVEDVYAGLLQDLIAVLSPQDVTPERRIAGIFERVARTSERELDVMCMILREALVSSERLQRVVQRFERGHVPLVLQTLAQGLQGGRFDPALHPAVIVISAISLAMFPHVVHRALTRAELPWIELLPERTDAGKALANVFLHGVAGPALRTPPERPGQARPRSRLPARTRKGKASAR
jgi:AcrR family transcriptional regulator